MTKEMYFTLCQYFDWMYAMSDDNHVYTAGNAGERNLVKYYEANPEWKAIYDAWHDFYYSGSNFGKPQAPKPVWEDFV